MSIVPRRAAMPAQFVCADFIIYHEKDSYDIILRTVYIYYV